MEDIGLSIYESTVRWWYKRVRKQIEQVLTEVVAWVQILRPEVSVPSVRARVRNRTVWC